MCGGKPKVDNSGTKFAQQEAKRARAEEAARQARIKTGMTAIGNTFSDANVQQILDARKTAMTGYYVPQLDKQHADAGDELTYALARAGLGTSTAANSKRDDLESAFETQKAGVMSDIARDQAATKSSIGQQRTTLEGQLNATGDATAATNAALASRASFAADMPTLAPLANTLAGFASSVGQAANGYQVGQIQQQARGRNTSTLNRDLSRVLS